MQLALGVLCLAALALGALFGDWTAGHWQPVPISAGGIARCFGGGMLMDWGVGADHDVDQPIGKQVPWVKNAHRPELERDLGCARMHAVRRAAARPC